MRQTACLLGLVWVLVGMAPATGRAQCLGDFNGDNKVSISELIVAVNNSLDECQPLAVRFVDNGDGTVTDHRTGLMWEKKHSLDGTANPSDRHDADNLYAWSATLRGTAPDGSAYTDFLSTLNNCTSNDGTAIAGGFAGHCDWRLPTSAELQSILLEPYPCGRTSPCIDPIFGPTPPGGYWSDTTLPDAADGAWYVDFNFGVVFNTYKGDTSYVRAVRGGF